MSKSIQHRFGLQISMLIRPTGTLKSKSASGRDDAFFLVDQKGVIAPGEEEWWIHISEYLSPYSEQDRALTNVLDDIKTQTLLFEPSLRVDVGDL